MKPILLTEAAFPIVREAEICPECNLGSRLSNGLCVNCILRNALTHEAASTEEETFQEALATARTQEGDWSIGGHEILDEIARGGMGVVYRAREPASGRIVALKYLLAYQVDSAQALTRFRREAETAARLDHPNIVPIYHVGETPDGSPFFTMKYASNGNLLQARGSLRQKPRQGVLVVAKIARAVQYAHEQGVLHRDLQPANVLLDSRNEPLVSDFGLARSKGLAGHLTRSLTSFGTPGYIAPEQADGPAARLTPAADIYSLGVILFELLTGRLPFEGDNALGVMKQWAEKPAPSLRTVAPHLDRDLETICGRCLERDPQARYLSAGGLAEDLERWLAGRPIAARPIGPWVHFRRWVRNNRRLATLLATSLVLAGLLVNWQRAHTKRLHTINDQNLLASRSVVILPFLDMDKVIPDTSLAQSVASSLQRELALLGPALVKTAGSASAPGWGKPKDIRAAGQEAQTRTVLTGTVRTVHGRKQISLRLLDSASGDPLFTVISVVAGQEAPTERISKDLAKQFYAILSAKDWTAFHSKRDPGLRNDVAREAITAGRTLHLQCTTASCIDKAIALYRTALVAEPGSALAHSYLSSAATSRTYYESDRSFLDIGASEADKAILLSPESGDAHRAKAGVYYQRGEIAKALDEQLQTIEMGGIEERVCNFIAQTLIVLGQPHHALKWCTLPLTSGRTPGLADRLVGDCWLKLGDDERALHAYHRAIELEPQALYGLIGVSHVQLLQGQFDDARTIYSRTGHLHQSEPNDADQLEAQIEFFARNFRDAERMYTHLMQRDKRGGVSFCGAIGFESALGRIKQELGDREGANKFLKESLAEQAANAAREPGNPKAAICLAAVEASLGMSDAALDHLRKAISLGWVDYRSLKLDPRFDSIRSTPTFETMINDLSAKVADMRLAALSKESDLK
jgi:serine/threonine protein kinase/tetratricopeptide (TPR) repeat protein